MKRERVIGIRVNQEEMRWLLAAARRCGVPVSAWARVVLKHAAGWSHPAADDAAYADIRAQELEQARSMLASEKLAVGLDLSKAAGKLREAGASWTPRS